jgi:DNA-binding NarL/FixJ family response regulator
MLARGLTNKQTAQELSISPKTVGRHVEAIYSKIGASTRAAAALFAVEHDLLGP